MLTMHLTGLVSGRVASRNTMKAFSIASRFFDRRTLAGFFCTAGLASLTVACGSDGFAMGKGGGNTQNCTQGAEGCFCRVSGPSCALNLICIDDRCVHPGVQTHKPGGSDGPAASGEQTPDPEKKPLPDGTCETDADCEDGNACTRDTCINAYCTHGERDGVPCDDHNSCTADDTCVRGTCMGRDTRVLKENFSWVTTRAWSELRDVREWYVERGEIEDTFVKDDSPSTWQIGPAQPSVCGQNSGFDTGEDPASDFSPTSDNGVAGVKIGGCHETPGDWMWDCLFSPPFETDFFEAKPRFSYRRHLHAPGIRTRRRLRGVEHRVVLLRHKDNTVETIIRGYEGVSNDSDWVEVSKAFARQSGAASIGFCFRRGRHARDFAGWSVDEVRIAQTGCAE